jgi:malate dehydrogenase (oxaloacetate-decarboxylating)
MNRGIDRLRCPLANKGTAFTNEERTALGLHGLLPPVVETLEQQVTRAYAAYRLLESPLDKHRYLRALQDRQEILFSALVAAHVEEMLPIVYTPTVGEAVRRFSDIYETPRGLSLSTSTIGMASQIVASFPREDVRLVVATDSSAILGIGDQGHGGLAIAIGKLSLYTLGGMNPAHTLPVVLDVGTDREDLLADPAYLGARHRRLRGAEHRAFVDAFVAAIASRWPRAVVQWEDFAKETAFDVLARHRSAVPSFNDDIQGTGAVALAGLLNACRLRGQRLSEQRVVVHGAGAGGIGVASAIRSGMQAEGLTARDATSRIFVTDSKGLLTEDRAMEEYKRPFAQPARAEGAAPAGLAATIRHARATVLIGLSGQPRVFDEESTRALLDHTSAPIIFPLSNPTSSCEGAPSDLLAWTRGAAIVATGSPFPPVSVDGRTVEIGQGNNAFIFPGLGLGAVVAEARAVTDGMVLAAAYALARLTEERWPDRVYPPIAALGEVATHVAAEVVARAIEDGVARTGVRSRADIAALVASRTWQPRYSPVELR